MFGRAVSNLRADVSSMLDGIIFVLRRCAVNKVPEAVVCRVPVSMPNFLLIGAWTFKYFQYKFMYIANLSFTMFI